MCADGRIMYRIIQDFYKEGITQTAKVYRRLLQNVIPKIYKPGQIWL